MDLASVDRRNQDSEEETSERVKELTNVYANSEMHKDVVYRIIEDTMKPTTGKQLLYQRYYQYRPQGSSFFRTLVTLLRYLETIWNFRKFANTYNSKQNLIL